MKCDRFRKEQFGVLHPKHDTDEWPLGCIGCPRIVAGVVDHQAIGSPVGLAVDPQPGIVDAERENVVFEASHRPVTIAEINDIDRPLGDRPSSQFMAIQSIIDILHAGKLVIPRNDQLSQAVKVPSHELTRTQVGATGRVGIPLFAIVKPRSG